MLVPDISDLNEIRILIDRSLLYQQSRYLEIMVPVVFGFASYENVWEANLSRITMISFSLKKVVSICIFRDFRTFMQYRGNQ